MRELVGNGLIVLFGNNDSPLNYPANAYKFRQDSSFLYFFGVSKYVPRSVVVTAYCLRLSIMLRAASCRPS